MRLEGIDGALNHGLVRGDGGAVQGQAFLEKWRSIHHHVGLGDQRGGVGVRDILLHGGDFEAGIQLPQALHDVLHARQPQPGVRLEQLAVEIARQDLARMRQHEAADAGGGELVGHIATQTAHAGDQHRGTLELPLRRLAEAGQPHLPLVDGAFFGSEFWQVHGRSLKGRTDRRKPALHRGNNLLWITANNSLRHGHDMRHPEPIRPGRVHAH